MQVLRRELKLHIDDFGKENTLNELIRNFHKLVLDFTSKMRYDCVVQTRVNSEGIRRG